MPTQFTEEQPRKLPLYIIAALVCFLSIAAVLLFFWRTPLFERFFPAKRTLLPVEEDMGKTAIPPSALLSQADEALSSGDIVQAISLYERVLERGQDLPAGGDVQVMRSLFDAAVLLGDQEKAESALGLLSFRGVSESTLDALRGFLSLRSGNLEKARAIFEEGSGPEHVYGRLLLDLLAEEHERARETLALLSQSVDPILVHAAQSIQGAYDEFALFEDGQSVHLQTLIARALAQTGQCPMAELLLRDIVEQAADYRDAWLVLGYCTLLLQEDEEALFAFEQAYALDPEKAETQYFLGLVHEKNEEDLQAQMYFGYALQNGFRPARTLHEKLALSAREAGDMEKAMTHYRAILKEDPDSAAYRTLISLLVERGELKEAKTLADRAYEELGDDAGALDLVGWMALLEEDLDRAATFLHAAVQQNPLLASAWYHKGLLAEKVGERREALEAYEKAYSLALGTDNDLAREAAEKYNGLIVQ